MKRILQTAAGLLAAALLLLLGAGLYDLTAPRRPAAPTAAPRPAPRPALLLIPSSPSSSAPHVYAA